MSKLSLVKLITTASVASMLTLSSGGLWVSAQANDSNSNSNNVGLPGRRFAGGTRGGLPGGYCSYAPTSLVALMPENSVALTASESPTLFFFVPQTNQSQQLEFVLRDGKDQLVYENTFTHTGKAGIISLKLPAVVKSNSLQSKEDYHWYFSVVCQQDRAQDLVVEGLIRKVDLDPRLVQKLNQSSLLDQVGLYQQAKLWHEALALVAANLVSPNRPDMNNKWTELLNSVGLARLAQEPLLAADKVTQANQTTVSSRPQTRSVEVR